MIYLFKSPNPGNLVQIKSKLRENDFLFGFDLNRVLISKSKIISKEEDLNLQRINQP